MIGTLPGRVVASKFFLFLVAQIFGLTIPVHAVFVVTAHPGGSPPIISAGAGYTMSIWETGERVNHTSPV